MKKIILLFFVIVGCSVRQNESSVSVNTNPEIQAKYKQAWLEATKNITELTPYTGEADIWGGGAFPMSFLFDKQGNLQNYVSADSGNPEIFNLHPLISQQEKFADSSFLDEKTAIVFMPSSADFSGKLVGSVYILRLSNDTLYRTKSANGFNHIDTWDGLSADTDNLMIIGTK